MSHTDSSFKLKATSSLNSVASDESWRVRDIYIFVCSAQEYCEFICDLG